MNPFGTLLLAGAAFFLLGGRRGGVSKGPKASPVEIPKNVEVFLDPEVIGPVTGGGRPSAGQPIAKSKSTWAQRQQALEFISNHGKMYLADGSYIYLCEGCDPLGVDGIVGPNTRNAVRAFQEFVGLPVTGEWDLPEDAEVQRVLLAIQNGEPITCDPLKAYPDPWICLTHPDIEGFFLQPQMGTSGEIDEPTPTPAIEEPSGPAPSVGDPGEIPEWSPDDILVADADCNFMIHESEEFYHIRKRMIISYALNDMTSGEDANEIHEILMAEYLPLCLTLGYNGVGEGVKQWWDINVGHIATDLKSYETSPEFLEEDAQKYGLL